MLIEQVLRGVGGLFAYLTLLVLLVGLWRGTRHKAGRVTGRTGAWLGSRWFYVITSVLFLGLCFLGWDSLPLVISPSARAWTLVLGSLLYFPGLVLVLWARFALGKNYFAATGLGVQLFADHQLVTHGPFAILRHPMYVGIILVASGCLFLYVTWTTLFLALLSPFILLRARREEEALAAEFGVQWQEYCKRVPAFFPWLRKSKGR